ncbi:MAG: RNA polymerase sigma factor [Candidatus Eremiobacteraeota bacterium]|nr:RNA polymerase sigma factor [Candidatus Eremiobacteraeota bacterium]
MDDDELIARIRAGDLDAANSLLSSHQDAAYTTALRLLGKPSDAEDIAQDALVRAYTHLAELRENGNFSAWLRRIVVNLSLNALRHQGVLQFESLEEKPTEQSRTSTYGACARTTEDRVLADEFRDEVATLLEGLPPEQRVAVVLRDMYEYDVAEIAQLQRCGLSAAKMRITRGRDSLRRLLGEGKARDAGNEG